MAEIRKVLGPTYHIEVDGAEMVVLHHALLTWNRMVGHANQDSLSRRLIAAVEAARADEIVKPEGGAE